MSYVDISKYRVNEPYPIVNISGENRFLSALLQDDYAGIVSEYTSISQFIYGYIISDEADLSDDFFGIALVEMTHLDLLGDIIKQLGGNPVFKSGNGMVWNSNVLAYSNSTKNRLKLCLKIKQRSLDQYKTHISRINDADIKNLLQRITLDEELHIQILKEHLDRFKNKHEDNNNEDNYDSRDKYDDNDKNSYNDNVSNSYNDSNEANTDNNTNTNYDADNHRSYNNSQYTTQSNQQYDQYSSEYDDKDNNRRNSRQRRHRDGYSDRHSRRRDRYEE